MLFFLGSCKNNKQKETKPKPKNQALLEKMAC
jgi:hypothetical protein